MRWKEIMAIVIQYLPPEDLKALKEAYHYAAKAHAGIKRLSGELYINHPLAIVGILAKLEMDIDTLVAGMLHDTVEDTEVTLAMLEQKFGPGVAQLVDGVTKLSRLEYRSQEERQVQNLRKMFLAMARDVRVVLIKLADRLHNMRTLDFHKEHKQREIAAETLEIYAPLANRLGIYRLKWELEDLSFRYSDPSKYHQLADLVARTRDKREENINQIIVILHDKIKEVNIKAEIQGRPKNLYSIHKKMEKQKLDFNQIYDVMAIRVLVHSVRDCYAVLGTVHTVWVPIPGRFKDYIAMPKSNGYQSLHTTVVSPQGGPLEIQIRTWEMHRTAEYGIAAHWRYKEGGSKEGSFDHKLGWLRQILDLGTDLKDAKEFMEGLKIDFFTDVVFVFTPQGDVLELPKGSTPLDFAYRVHTQVGHRCIGAKVNNKIVPLDYKLKNWDRVEVLTSRQSSGPNRDWLNIVKTSQAKTKIRHWFRKEQREENIIKGRELMEREFRKCGLDLELVKSNRLLEGGKKNNIADLEDVYVAVADGSFSVVHLVRRLQEELNQEQAQKEIEKKSKKEAIEAEEEKVKATIAQESRLLPGWGKPTQGIRVRGVDNLLIRLARCCNPVPGDQIVGYTTRGRGVSVHLEDCPNVEAFLNEPDRLVEVAWDKDFSSPFQVRLEIIGAERYGMLNDIMSVLQEMRISANWVNGRRCKDNIGVVEIAMQVKNVEQLDHIISKFLRVKEVYSVHRVGQHITHKAGDNF